MIPFASQRALGQDLATHLMNEHDNEYMEVAELRGAIAEDLHGAFAEWEMQAHSLTRCRNYLYSLSVNPDPAQGPLTREQYLDYIARVEDRLGLSGQPRAVIFHIKGEREHCHVVWSRIDTEKEKAVQIAFDRDKLMMVTREFAREHGLELPDGYFKGRDRDRGKTKQLSLYEMHQQRSTGLTKDERMEHVTEAWRHSDSPKAFVQALGHLGYTLATGTRPYVLVDIYGHTNALPKLIDDRRVRTRDVRAFLEMEFPPESLPTVEEAKALAARHREAIKDFHKSQSRADRLDALKQFQAERRAKLEREQADMAAGHGRDRRLLLERRIAKFQAHRAAYLAETKHLRRERYGRRPKGLAGFLARVTGLQLLRKKIYQHQDKKRHQAFLLERLRLRDHQDCQGRELQRRHEMQGLDLARKVRALDQIEKRERQSLETALLQERRVRARAGHEHMPSLELTLTPPGRRAVPHKAMHRHTSPLARELAEAARARKVRPRSIDLSRDFARATDGDHTGGDDGGSSDGPKPTSQPNLHRHRRRKRDRDKDLDRGR